MRVGVVGLGRMGRPMAERLLDTGMPVTVWARRPEAAAPLVARGARSAASLPALAAGVDVLLTCLPRPRDVQAVAAAFLKHARPGTLWIEASTIDPATSRRLGMQARRRRVDYVDAPVSGGPEGAARGTLTIMAGGPPERVDRARPVLGRLGTHLHHMGPTGSGHLAKLCNQVLTGVAYAAIAEALTLARRGGLDPAALLAVLSTASGRSRSLEQAGPAMVARAFSPAAFTADLAGKDLECALAAGHAVGAPLSLAARALGRYRALRRAGLGALDQAAVLLAVERGAAQPGGERTAGAPDGMPGRRLGRAAS
jgi:3-hydroxyisobutyrate dehydrogenase